MRKIISGILIATMMAACSSTPTKEQDGAKVEDRTLGTQQPVKPPAQVVEAQKVTPAEVDPGSALGADPSLKDPKSILSKRIVYFDFDSNLVKEEFRPLVTAHAQYVTRNGKAKMMIQGHTDERGSREYNLALGQRRADAVKQMMTVLGAENARVETVSYGEEKPRAQGTTEAAYAENRRAEILYQGE